MGTPRGQMIGVLPWLVRWTRRAGTRDFYPALAALVSVVQNIIFLTIHTLFHLISPHHSATWAGSRAGSPVSVSLVSSIELTDGGGGRVGGRSRITRPQKSLALYKIIQYSLDTRVMTRGSHALSICIAAWVRRPG
jgi:hypothetical protein